MSRLLHEVAAYVSFTSLLKAGSCAEIPGTKRQPSLSNARIWTWPVFVIEILLTKLESKKVDTNH